MASLNKNKNTYTYISTLFYFIYVSLEDFQLLDNEPLDNSIIKTDFTKLCHRQGDQLNQSD